MDQQIEKFLNTSPLAEKVKLPGKIVIHRTQLTPGKIAAIKNNGEYSIPADETICQFQVGNILLAGGKLIEKEGEYYFQPIIGTQEEEK